MIERRIHGFATKTIEWAAKLGFSYSLNGLVCKSHDHAANPSTETLEWAAKLGFCYPFHGLVCKTHDRAANPWFCDQNYRMGIDTWVQLPIPWFSLANPMIGSQIHSFATGTLEWATKL